jgi:uncharacterized secreted protein with C-terminal beta-propeller domain
MSGRTGSKGRTRKVVRTGAGTGAALAVILSYGTVTGGVGRAAADELPQFGNCDEFTAYMRGLAENEATAYGIGGGPVMYKNAPQTAEGTAPASDSRAGAVPGAAPVGNGPTGTNVQEQGVDEPDIAKIDGNRVLSLVNGKLTVVDASGTKPKLASTYSFPEGQYPNELLVLHKHRVMILGTGYEQQSDPTVEGGTADTAGKRAPGVAPEYYRPASPYVVLTMLDLTDATRPRVVRIEKITGSYITARLTDGVARIVLTSQPRIAFSPPREGEPEALAEARNKEAARNAKAEDFLPERQILDRAGKLLKKGPLLGCGAVRHPAVQSGLGIISVLTLDTENGGQTFDSGRGQGVVSNGELVYASADRLYVATTDGGWNSPRPVDVTPNTQPREQEVRTRIHAFNVTGRNDSPYVATGSVPGFLFGRWALSEWKGDLRVATTTGQPWAQQDGTPSQSSVVVLDEHGDQLRRVGSVSGLGKGEQIRAVRWFDDIAAVVTFRQTDPLYLVDLADPAHPAVRGELKVNGYSAYLHPVGDDHILGIGQDADDTGRVSGLQVSDFDLSNLAKPTRDSAIGYGRGWTDVENDSRAFTYLPGRRLAVLPAWVTQQVPCPPDAQCYTAEGKPGFVGEIQVPAALGISVGADGTLKRAGKFVADSYILRVLPIGDRLVAITGNSIVFLDPDTFAPTGAVKLTQDQPKPVPMTATAEAAPPPAG